MFAGPKPRSGGWREMKVLCEDGASATYLVGPTGARFQLPDAPRDRATYRHLRNRYP